MTKFLPEEREAWRGRLRFSRRGGFAWLSDHLVFCGHKCWWCRSRRCPWEGWSKTIPQHIMRFPISFINNADSSAEASTAVIFSIQISFLEDTFELLPSPSCSLRKQHKFSARLSFFSFSLSLDLVDSSDSTDSSPESTIIPVPHNKFTAQFLRSHN